MDTNLMRSTSINWLKIFYSAACLLMGLAVMIKNCLGR